jgi:hypothetical protein
MRHCKALRSVLGKRKVFCKFFWQYFVIVWLVGLTLTKTQLILNLTSSQTGAIKQISYCIQCPDPSVEGSLIRGLNAKFGLQHFSKTGELVYCVPNYGEKERLLNSHQLDGRIVFVERGKVSLLEKVLRIQHQSEAIAIIIADDGSCDESFHNCGPRAGSVNDGGFAAYDDELKWQQVEIPVILITRASAEKLKGLMRSKSILVRGSGQQHVTIIDSDEL